MLHQGTSRRHTPASPASAVLTVSPPISEMATEWHNPARCRSVLGHRQTAQFTRQAEQIAQALQAPVRIVQRRHALW